MDNILWYQKLEKTSEKMIVILKVYGIENNCEEKFEELQGILEAITFNELQQLCERESDENIKNYLISCVECVRFFSIGFSCSGKTGEMFRNLYFIFKSQAEHLYKNK